MDTFIKHLDDEVNNLDKQVNEILKDETYDIIPDVKIKSSKTTQIELETRRT